MLTQVQVDEEEERIRAESLNLPAHERQLFHKQFNAKLKDPDTFAALAWSLPVGLHHFYLGKYLRGLLDIFIFFLGVVFCVSGEPILITLGILLIIGVSLFELYSLFRSAIIVQDHNNQVMRRILAEVRNQHVGRS